MGTRRNAVFSSFFAPATARHSIRNTLLGPPAQVPWTPDTTKRRRGMYSRALVCLWVANVIPHAFVGVTLVWHIKQSAVHFHLAAEWRRRQHVPSARCELVDNDLSLLGHCSSTAIKCGVVDPPHGLTRWGDAAGGMAGGGPLKWCSSN
jgi:hypothetical protein